MQHIEFNKDQNLVTLPHQVLQSGTTETTNTTNTFAIDDINSPYRNKSFIDTRFRGTKYFDLGSLVS